MTTRNFRVKNGLSVGDITISASAGTITGLSTAAPSADGDTANKKYVDDQINAISTTSITTDSNATNATVSGTGASGTLTITANSNTEVTVTDSGMQLGGSGARVNTIADEDNMSSDSATALATQQSIKAYVDAQVTASDLDFQGDSGGALSIDLDSETLDIAGGTGIDTVGSSNTLTVAIDSTVATLAGTQTFTNKTFDANGTGNSLTNIDSGNFLSGFFLDEDNMASNDATAVASQQSIKAYVDTEIGNISSTTLTAGNTTAVVSDTGSDGAFTVTAEGNTELVINDTSATFSGNVIVTGDLNVNGTTTTVNTTNTTVSDNIMELNSGISASSNDIGFIFERGSTGNNAAIIWDESEDKFTMGTTTATAGDKSGGITVSASTLVANLEGDVTGTATEATNVTVTANNTANETVYLTFVDGATGTQGIETDTGLSYNPSTNVLTTTAAQAQYADLAEKYTTSTGDLAPGTVVRVLIGPGHNDALPEVEPAMQDSIPVGVISTAPAYLMNADSEGQAVALKGRVPVKVTGAVTKGQAVYVDDNGHATASNTGSMMVGVALESNGDSAVKLVECVLKV